MTKHSKPAVRSSSPARPKKASGRSKSASGVVDENGKAKTPAPPKAGGYVLTKLRELDVALVDTVPRVLAHQDDDEAVHDLRVAIRRLRTLLKMSRGLFGRWHTDVVREAFAEVMRATGDLRDEEVLEETLSGAAEGAEYDAWLRARKSREAKLRRNVIARIERGDLDRARLMLKALLVFPIEPERNVELAKFARRTVEGARRKVEGKRDVEVEDVTGMHDLRIAYKELRYSIELLADALPIDARAQLEPATVFQKRLGELHDVDVATEVVQKAKGLSIAARAEALRSLAHLRDKRVNKYLRELDPLGAGAPKVHGDHHQHHHDHHHDQHAPIVSTPTPMPPTPAYEAVPLDPKEMPTEAAVEIVREIPRTYRNNGTGEHESSSREENPEKNHHDDDNDNKEGQAESNPAELTGSGMLEDAPTVHIQRSNPWRFRSK